MYTQDGQQPSDVKRLPHLRSLQRHGQEKTSNQYGKPVKRHTEPIIIAMNSIPSRNDVVTLLQSLGCIIHNVLLLGPRILHSPFIVGDGEAVTYRVRLKLDGKTIDETELKISYS
jgi:hypothetical protein